MQTITRAILPRNQSPSVSNSQRGRSCEQIFDSSTTFLNPLVATNSLYGKRTVGFFFSLTSHSLRACEARALLARKTSSYATLHRFLYWFWEKNRLFCSLIRRTGGSVCRYIQWNHPPFPITEPSTYNRSQISQSPSKWNVLFQNRIIAPMIAKPFPSMSQHTKMLQKSRDPSGHFRVSDDL